jgi:heterodisulfide reductase subunit A
MARVAVIGGGPAGLASALYLADRNQEVILVEKDERLGGSPLVYNCKAVDECRQCGACLAAEQAYQVQKHPLVQVMTGSRVVAARLVNGVYQMELSDAEGTTMVEAAGIILATGFGLFNPAIRSEMGYPRLERVVTARELEEILKNASGDWEEELGIMPRIAMVRCFGSREQSRGVSYCSRVCCLYSEKLAQILIDRISGATVDIFCMDAQRYHPVYATERVKSVRYIRGMPARVDRLPNQALVVKYEDSATSQIEQGHYDWLVLCSAVLPAQSDRSLCEMLDIEKDNRGFIASVGGSTNQKGVFAAGCCTGPKTIVESLYSGQTAAGLLLKHLSSA